MTAKKKKRLPIQELRETAKVAEEILRNRGIHTKDSAIEEIDAQNRVMLPGRAPYLPHRWTLQASRRVLADVVIVWMNKTKNDRTTQEDHKQFFPFMCEELTRIVDKFHAQDAEIPSYLQGLKDTVLLSRVFKPKQNMETASSMVQFLVDAFAVCVALHTEVGEVKAFSVSDFVYWFDDYTNKLNAYWDRPAKHA